MNNKPVKSNYPVLSFEKPEELRKWLDKNHAISSGIWLRIFKKK